MRSDYEVPETDQNVSIPFAELLLKARKDYDVVIVDTAPAFPTNQRMIDPVEICKSSDGVVVVTLTNKTPRQELKRVCSAIETVGAHIMGIVANHWQNPLY
jgi:Mrp family chromosome partitioning ATPase